MLKGAKFVNPTWKRRGGEDPIVKKKGFLCDSFFQERMGWGDCIINSYERARTEMRRGKLRRKKRYTSLLMG